MEASFAKTEICKSDVSIAIDKNVFWLEISIDNTWLMQIFKSKHHFCSVKLCSILFEPPRLLQVVEQLSTVHELHNEVESLLILEGIL